jgi:ABC-type uncharacterized transport system permease subunit
MAETSVFWLRVAAAFYSLGLLHAILTLTRRREQIFRVALGASALGAVFHFVSIVEDGLASRQCPITNFYQTLSMCAFLIVLLYLFVEWRYKLHSMSVILFPLVFVMSLVATFGNPVGSWPSPVVGGAWLTAHIALALLGYAALALMALASVLYLAQERALKSKKPRKSYPWLPALGVLDEFIAKSMGAGFALITLAVITASIWAFIEHKTAWISQPGIPIAFFTWGVYLVLICLRTTVGWRGRKSALMTVIVLACSAATWVAHAQLGALLAGRQ